MLLAELQLDRNLIKQPNQTNATDDTSYVSSNPRLSPSNGSANNNPTNAPGVNGAGQIITGSVITACLIQTSASPDRIELANSRLSLYDNTIETNGVISGMTGEIFFTHDLNSNEGFIMEKRASVYNTYDNVLSLYALPAASGDHNWIFIGRNAAQTNQERNVGHIGFAINTLSTDLTDANHVALNGTFIVEYSVDGVQASPDVYPLFLGNSKYINSSLSGYSAIISGGQGGISGMGYVHPDLSQVDVLLYCLSNAAITLGAPIIPDTDNTYNIGSATERVKDVHVGGRLNVGKVTDAGPMTATAGTVGDIVFNTSNLKFYGCTVTGTPATWSALN